MAKLPTCPYCGKEIQKNEPLKKFKNKSYHLSCYQKYCDEVYKNTSTTDKNEAQQELYDYICRLFNIKELTPYLNNQLQKIFKENNFTYNGVLYSLKYWYETKENPIDVKYGIGIVPFIYEEAKQFYIKKSILWEKNANIEIKNEQKTVKVPSKRPRKKPFVDISNL